MVAETGRQLPASTLEEDLGKCSHITGVERKYVCSYLNRISGRSKSTGGLSGAIRIWKNAKSPIMPEHWNPVCFPFCWSSRHFTSFWRKYNRFRG